jgi:hypothetical protein
MSAIRRAILSSQRTFPLLPGSRLQRCASRQRGDPRWRLFVDSSRPECANTGHSSAAQHAESDRPRATLDPLAWRFLIAELAIGSGSVCAIVYAAISSISISAHSALSSGLSEPWVTTPIPKLPEGTPQRHRDASVKPCRTGACPHDRKSSRSRYANLRRDGRQFLGRAEHSRAASAVRSLRQR